MSLILYQQQQSTTSLMDDVWAKKKPPHLIRRNYQRNNVTAMNEMTTYLMCDFFVYKREKSVFKVQHSPRGMSVRRHVAANAPAVAIMKR